MKTQVREPQVVFKGNLVEAMGLTADSFFITNIEEILAELLGAPDIEPPFDEGPLMFVCSTRDRMFGSAALAFPEVFHRFCEKMEWDEAFIIPSSIHELILVPTGTLDPNELAGLVREINEGCVAEEDRMDPAVFLYQKSTDKIVVVARA